MKPQTIISYIFICCLLNSCVVKKETSVFAKKHISKGTKAFHNKLFDISEAHFNLAIEIEPTNASAYNGLGLIAFSKGNLKRSEIMFRQSIILNPDFAEAYNNLGVLLQQKGNFKLSEKLFKKSLKINPDYNDARFNLALSELQNNKFKNAKWNFAKLYASSKNNMLYLLYLLYTKAILKQTHNIEKKLNEIAKNLIKNKEKYWFFIIKGVVLFNKTKYEQAIINFTKAIKIKPLSIEAYFQVAKTYFILQRYDLTKKYLNKVLNINHNKHLNLKIIKFKNLISKIENKKTSF